MLKNKLKIIALFMVIILSLALPIVKADDETNNNPIQTPDDETTASIDENTSNPDSASPIAVDPSTNTSNTTQNDENFKKSDIYITGDNVTIDYIIDGNLFVIANHVTINAQIGGDAFICSNSVTIGEQGYIFSNLFTFSKDVVIDGVVYDLYAASENTTINGYIYRDIRVGSNTVNILGTVGRNAYIKCANMNFSKNKENSEQENSISSQGVINGNLKYSAQNEASIPEGVVSGDTTFEPKVAFQEDSLQDKLMYLVSFVITVIFIWLICLWLAPKFIKNSSAYLTTKKVLPVIGFGILTPIVLILLSVLFFVLGITAVLGLLLLFLFFIFIAISNSVFLITLNRILCEKLKIEKTMVSFATLIALAIVLWLIGLIPIIGSILATIVIILGIGITTSNLILKEKQKIEEK